MKKCVKCGARMLDKKRCSALEKKLKPLRDEHARAREMIDSLVGAFKEACDGQYPHRRGDAAELVRRTVVTVTWRWYNSRTEVLTTIAKHEEMR